MFILFRPPSGLRGWLSSVFTQWSESSLRMILPDPFASADLSTVPWGSPNLPSSLCWDRKLEQAATKVLLGEAGIGLEVPGNREGTGTRFLQPNRCWGPVAAVKFKQPCWNPRASLQPPWWDTDRTKGWKTAWALGLQGSAFASGAKGSWGLVSLRHECQYCLMPLFSTWTMGWSTLLGNYTFQLA